MITAWWISFARISIAIPFVYAYNIRKLIAWCSSLFLSRFSEFFVDSSSWLIVLPSKFICNWRELKWTLWEMGLDFCNDGLAGTAWISWVRRTGWSSCMSYAEEFSVVRVSFHSDSLKIRGRETDCLHTSSVRIVDVEGYCELCLWWMMNEYDIREEVISLSYSRGTWKDDPIYTEVWVI